jgi:hypothetical protein
MQVQQGERVQLMPTHQAQAEWQSPRCPARCQRQARQLKSPLPFWLPISVMGLQLWAAADTRGSKRIISFLRKTNLSLKTN